jgi:hypothetical protein
MLVDHWAKLTGKKKEEGQYRTKPNLSQVSIIPIRVK